MGQLDFQAVDYFVIAELLLRLALGILACISATFQHTALA
jgi:cytochrome b